MLRLLGAVMIILGGIGGGYSYLEGKKKIINVIETWEYIMHLFLSEITYKKEPLSQAGNEIGKRIGGEEGEFLIRVSKRMQERKGIPFFFIWKEECRRYCEKGRLPEEERVLLNGFGTLTGFEDEEIQRKMIEEQVEKWKNMRVRKQGEHQERKRLILILSACMGTMMVLMLW